MNARLPPLGWLPSPPASAISRASLTALAAEALNANFGQGRAASTHVEPSPAEVAAPTSKSSASLLCTCHARGAAALQAAHHVHADRGMTRRSLVRSQTSFMVQPRTCCLRLSPVYLVSLQAIVSVMPAMLAIRIRSGPDLGVAGVIQASDSACAVVYKKTLWNVKIIFARNNT